MCQFQKDFLLGAATAAHQVEGNNIHSDFWAMEQLPHTMYKEKSLDAVDHYRRYREDLKLLADAGLNSYRFSIEWARIEPAQGEWIQAEIDHYRDVLKTCRELGITPIVTMHHFSSPKWLIEKGGWENPETVQWFARYCEKVVSDLGDLMGYVCTINEANMGLQISKIMQDSRRHAVSDVQVGINDRQSNMRAYMKEAGEAFGVDPGNLHAFLSPRTAIGDGIIIRAHERARDVMKEKCPHLKVGISLSLHDFQALPGGEANARLEWVEEFTHYLPYIHRDDFIGVQNYSRKLIGPEGTVQPDADAPRTQMGYEDYPAAIGNVTRKVAQDFKGEILITENGISTADDSRRIGFIREALAAVAACMAEGIEVKGYMYWTLLDNFEWQLGFTPTFGLIAVDRSSQTRLPKESLRFLGSRREH